MVEPYQDINDSIRRPAWVGPLFNIKLRFGRSVMQSAVERLSLLICVATTVEVTSETRELRNGRGIMRVRDVVSFSDGMYFDHVHDHLQQKKDSRCLLRL